MEKLLTQKDLAERWQVSTKAIENWRKDGILVPVHGVPAIRFSPQYIADLEGVKFERFSPLERKKLERENEDLKKENEELKGALAKIVAEGAKVFNYQLRN